MKTCTKCGVEQSIECFSRNKSRKDGLATMCKTCWNAYYKQYYKSGKETARLAMRRKAEREAIREYIHNIKNVPCMDCKIKYPYYVMQFDHRGDKDFTIAKKVGSHSLKRIKAEIAKCDIVCANCHAERTWGSVPA